MPRFTLRSASTAVGALLLAAGSAMAQSTAPFWSSYFGGSNWDEIVVIRRGPGNLMTVVGHTLSTNLPVTPGCWQPSPGGNYDVFVARFDVATQQMLWCTYLGGSDIDHVFDAEVDPTSGITTVVGLTASPNFPSPTPPVPPNGPTDGFVAQLDPSGSVLLASMLIGGSADDRVCDVEVDSAGVVTIAGVTESSNLPATAGTVGPAHHGGGTDAFVAQVLPTSSVWLWATYLGGSSTEGMAYVNYTPGMTWPPNLDRIALTIDPAGRPAIATVSNVAAVNAPTTPGCYQPLPAGFADAYLVVLNAMGASLHHGTFLGGAISSDRPHAIVAHPGGGFVVGGYTFSSDFPTTPGCMDSTFGGGTPGHGVACDGFISQIHIDPSSGVSSLLYSTFFGGSVGEDAVMDLAIESSGHVTAVGYSWGGGVWTTPRCHQDSIGASQNAGVVARIQLAGNGLGDVLYSTYVGGIAAGTRTIFVSAALDDVGDVWVAGATTSSAYPQTSIPPLPQPGGRDGCFTHLPLLPGGVFRHGLPFANPACSAPLYTGAGSAPVPGNTFLITATNAPPNMPGMLVLGAPIPPVPLLPLLPPLNGTLLVDPIVLPPVGASATGAAQFPIPLSPLLPSPPGWGLAAQWFFFTNAACPGNGMLTNSERLNF